MALEEEDSNVKSSDCTPVPLHQKGALRWELTSDAGVNNAGGEDH